jgi:hypothetical protein
VRAQLQTLKHGLEGKIFAVSEDNHFLYEMQVIEQGRSVSVNELECTSGSSLSLRLINLSRCF